MFELQRMYSKMLKVYSFTSNYALDKEDVSQSDMEFDLSDLVLAELFSSEMSSREYNEAFQMVSCQILNSNNYRFSQQGISKFEHLGGNKSKELGGFSEIEMPLNEYKEPI